MIAENNARLYFDYNATAPCRKEVIADVLQTMNDCGGNPSSRHREGKRARRLVEQSRERIATALGADTSEILFTSGGTEADNLAVFGSLLHVSTAGVRPHLVTSIIEHPAVLESCRTAEDRRTATVTWVKCDACASIAPSAVARAITPDTALVSIMHANNEVGTIQAIRQIANVAHEHGVPVHCDAIQSLGRIPVNVVDLGVDLLSISGHKLGGPKGTGALYVRKGTWLAPILVGGPHERDRRAGTENVAGVVGFATAVRIAVETQPSEARRLTALRDAMWASLRDLPGIRINGDLSRCLPNTLSVSFDDLSADDLLEALDCAGVAVSTGSACAARAGKSSHVIQAMGEPASRGCGPLRISLGYRTTESETARCTQIIKQEASRLRASGRRCCCAA